MIIFGIRERTLDGPDHDGLVCPRCGGTRFATSGRQRYFHIYRVPVLPLSRSIAAHCAECGHEPRPLPAHLANRVEPRIFTAGRTLSRFSGLLLLLTALALLAPLVFGSPGS